MSINRRVKHVATLVSLIIPIGAATETTGQAFDALRVKTATHIAGNPNAVPPILRPARPSERRLIRRVEAQEAHAFDYRVPADAQYSDAELNVYATEGYA
jgi:hypothetical protein